MTHSKSKTKTMNDADGIITKIQNATIEDWIMVFLGFFSAFFPEIDKLVATYEKHKTKIKTCFKKFEAVAADIGDAKAYFEGAEQRLKGAGKKKNLRKVKRASS